MVGLRSPTNGPTARSFTISYSVFSDRMRRDQMTFIIQLSSVSGARLGAFLNDNRATVERKGGQVDKLYLRV
jgi:hypothetical protein